MYFPKVPKAQWCKRHPWRTPLYRRKFSDKSKSSAKKQPPCKCANSWLNCTKIAEQQRKLIFGNFTAVFSCLCLICLTENFQCGRTILNSNTMILYSYLVPHRAFPFEGKVGCKVKPKVLLLATRMRWKINVASDYTSPPPAAEPLLKEKPLKDLHLNLMCRNCIQKFSPKFIIHY